MLPFHHKPLKNEYIPDFSFPICLKCKSLIKLERVFILSGIELIIKYSCLCKKQYAFKFRTYYTLLQYFSNLDFSKSKKYEGQINRTKYPNLITTSGCYCITCSEYLHEKIGIEEIRKGHFVVKHFIKDYNEKCSLHINEKITNYCLKCDKKLCLQCLSEHFDHLVKTLSEYYDYVNQNFVLIKLENIKKYVNEIMNLLSINNNNNVQKELIQLISLFKLPFKESIKMPNLTLIQSIIKFSSPKNLVRSVNQFTRLTKYESFTLSNPQKIKKDRIFDVEKQDVIFLQNKILVSQTRVKELNLLGRKRYIQISFLMVYGKDFKCEWKKKYKNDNFACKHANGNKILLRTDSETLYLCEYKRQMKVLKKWSIPYFLEFDKLNDFEILLLFYTNKFKVINLNTFKESNILINYPDDFLIDFQIHPIDNRLCIFHQGICGIEDNFCICLLNYRNGTIITRIFYGMLCYCRVVKNYLIIIPQEEDSEITILQFWSLTEMRIKYCIKIRYFYLDSIDVYNDIIILIDRYRIYFLEITKNNTIIISNKMIYGMSPNITCIPVDNNIILYFTLKEIVCLIGNSNNINC